LTAETAKDNDPSFSNMDTIENLKIKLNYNSKIAVIACDFNAYIYDEQLAILLKLIS